MTDPQNPTPAGDQQPASQPPAYEPPAEQPAAPPAYGQTAPPAYEAPAPGYGQGAPQSAPAYSAPAYPAEGYGAPPAAVPGKTMGIIALVLAIVPIGLQLVGLILGIVALVQSKKAGAKNTPALWAIIVSIVMIVIGVIVGIVLISIFAAATGDLASQVQACLDNGGTGFVEFAGERIPCSRILDDAGY